MSAITDMQEVLAELSALRAENERLREALTHEIWRTHPHTKNCSACAAADALSSQAEAAPRGWDSPTLTGIFGWCQGHRCDDANCKELARLIGQWKSDAAGTPTQPDTLIDHARHIAYALQQFDESVHNADGTSAQKFETLKDLLAASPSHAPTREEVMPSAGPICSESISDIAGDASAQTRDRASAPPTCPDCEEAAKHAYSDATTPGFFSPYCKKHEPSAESAKEGK